MHGLWTMDTVTVIHHASPLACVWVHYTKLHPTQFSTVIIDEHQYPKKIVSVVRIPDSELPAPIIRPWPLHQPTFLLTAKGERLL